MLTIHFSLFGESDIPALLSCIQTPRDLRAWSGSVFSYPLTEEQIQRHLDEISAAGSSSMAIKAVTADGRLVGYGELCKIRQGESAMIRRLLVRGGEFRRCGIGRGLVEHLLSLAFEEFNLHRVYLGVFDWNQPAIDLYTACGFQPEGSWREHVLMDGSFHTLNWMALLRPPTFPNPSARGCTGE